MCLAVPGRILASLQENGLKMARVDYAGTENDACLAYVPEADVGDYVIVHAGFALQQLNEEEARATLETLSELNAIIEADKKTDPESDPEADA